MLRFSTMLSFFPWSQFSLSDHKNRNVFFSHGGQPAKKVSSLSEILVSDTFFRSREDLIVFVQNFVILPLESIFTFGPPKSKCILFTPSRISKKSFKSIWDTYLGHFFPCPTVTTEHPWQLLMLKKYKKSKCLKISLTKDFFLKQRYVKSCCF